MAAGPGRRGRATTGAQDRAATPDPLATGARGPAPTTRGAPEEGCRRAGRARCRTRARGHLVADVSVPLHDPGVHCPGCPCSGGWRSNSFNGHRDTLPRPESRRDRECKGSDSSTSVTQRRRVTRPGHPPVLLTDKSHSLHGGCFGKRRISQPSTVLNPMGPWSLVFPL